MTNLSTFDEDDAVQMSARLAHSLLLNLEYGQTVACMVAVERDEDKQRFLDAKRRMKEAGGIHKEVGHLK